MVLDQFSCSAFQGSSGGGIFLRDGKYLSALTRGAGETFTLGVPIRRIREWCKKEKIEWAINPEIPFPAIDEIMNLPIEDMGKNISLSKEDGQKEFRTFIKIVESN